MRNASMYFVVVLNSDSCFESVLYSLTVIHVQCHFRCGHSVGFTCIKHYLHSFIVITGQHKSFLLTGCLQCIKG